MIEEHLVVWGASKFPTGRLGGAAARQYFLRAGENVQMFGSWMDARIGV